MQPAWSAALAARRRAIAEALAERSWRLMVVAAATVGYTPPYEGRADATEA